MVGRHVIVVVEHHTAQDCSSEWKLREGCVHEERGEDIGHVLHYLVKGMYVLRIGRQTYPT
jgi:hypothetical protein